jgi:hypothetical protein
MVFTHVPSSVCLILIPFMPDLSYVIALLFIRSALSQMDVPTRSSYVMAIVPPVERPAAASITSVPRSLASAVSPFLSGYLLSLSSFGWPLLVASSRYSRLFKSAACLSICQTGPTGVCVGQISCL